MILFLIGPPGIGKTTVAHELAILGATHLEVDDYRARIGASTTTNPVVEDAVNWRVFCAAALEAREGRLVVIDSTGASKRLRFLRAALDRYPQRVVRLTSSFPYASCAKKWGASYSLEQFNHILSKIQEVKADLDRSVDGTTSTVLAREIHAWATGG